MYLNNIDAKMQHNNHPHNFNMMNTRSLAVLPNPSETQVATLIVCSYHDTFLCFIQDNFSVFCPGCPGNILVEQAVHKLRDP